MVPSSCPLCLPSLAHDEQQRQRFQCHHHHVRCKNASSSSSFDELHDDRLGLNATRFKASSAPFRRLQAVCTDNSAGIDISTPFDWSQQLTGVKSQNGCASCGIFAATAVLEFLAPGNLVDLSEQQLLDCGSSTCDGGSAEDAYATAGATGVCSLNDYPYTAIKSTCNTCNQIVAPGALGAFSYVLDSASACQGSSTWEADVQAFISTEMPVTATVTGGDVYFYSYSGGILSSGSTCGYTVPGQTVDHSVVIVGYGTSSGINYWNLRNSWGTTWGESGYIRLERGFFSTMQYGVCQIQRYSPTYPTAPNSGISAPTPPTGATGPTGPSPPTPAPTNATKGGQTNEAVKTRMTTILSIAGLFAIRL